MLTLGAGSIGAVAPLLPARAGRARAGRGAEVNAVPNERTAIDALRNEPLRKHTSWRVGGPADLFYAPSTIAELTRVLAELPAATPVHWLGLGSNLLVRDGGIRGAVIATGSLPRELERLDDRRVRASAGLACMLLAKRCVRWHLGPAAFFAGIPGHGRRCARDERGCVRRRDVDACRERDDDRSPRRRARPAAGGVRDRLSDRARARDRVVPRQHVPLRARRIELDGRDQGAARPTQRGAAARVSELRLRVPQPAGRFRRPPHRAGWGQGPANRRSKGFGQARELHLEYRHRNGGGHRVADRRGARGPWSARAACSSSSRSV